LTEETTETLYRIGEADRIVGISGFTVRPPQARKEKPRVSAFTSARIDRILALSPDLVLGFSDLQADIAQELIRAGVSVMVFNHRSVSGILDMMKTLGAMVGASESAEVLIDECRANLEHARARTRAGTPRPRVYFEEWDAPQISAIRWVSELIEVAGGEDIFPELAKCPDGKSRIIADPEEVVRRRPDIIIGSWCGKKFRPEKVAARSGWSATPAVKNNALYEIKSAEILQPGPAALSDGLSRLCTIIDAWHAAHDRPVHESGQDITG
jgi:iron complex transport system substrate-binding protein